jgi:tetratricopeptide (TPR) repeat protein
MLELLGCRSFLASTTAFLLACACGVCPASTVAFGTIDSAQFTINSPDPEQTYIDALRERKLYRLLEAYCRRQLNRQDATQAERARYTIELANILATRAQTEPRGTTRADLWRQASALLRTFLEQDKQHPQAIALRFQLGVYELAQGELGRQQAKLAPQNKELIEQVRGHLQVAIQSFREVESGATQAMKKRPSGEDSATAPLSQNQLRDFISNGRFRLAQALLALAQTLPRNSADQTEMASQAKSQFEAFTQRYSTNELTLESYLGRAECLRLLGDSTEALKSLSELAKPGTPDKYYERSVVLRAHLQLDQKNPAAARNMIDDNRKLLKAPSPELDLLYVQALLELARQQSKGQADLVARQLVASAIDEIDRIEKQHGPYWASRCEVLLAELAMENVLVEDPAVLVRMADGQLRRADFSGAIRTLDRAVKLSRERGDTDRTVELAFRAASILLQEKDLDAAAERFAQIAGTYANHPKAPQAHFMVAYCLGQLYAVNPTTDRLATYERSLEQHLKAFGADDTALEVRWLLGSLRVSQRRWPDAIELFKGIPASYKQFLPAREQIRRSYEAWLEQLWQRAQPAESVVAEAIEFLKIALGDRRGKQWKPADVPMALALARIQLHAGVNRYQEAEEILNQILFGPAASDSERGEARRLIVAALVGQDKFDDARQLIETEFVGIPQELFAVAQALEDAASHSSESRRRQIGRLQLVVTERLVREAEHLTREQSIQAEIYLALAYVNAGQAARADELFAKLHDRAGNDPRVLQAQAECLMQLGRYAQARDLWRQVAGYFRENTPAWYYAKYNLALACYLSSDVTQALRIIQVTELLHPDLGGPEMKGKFEELKVKCRAN